MMKAVLLVLLGCVATAIAQGPLPVASVPMPPTTDTNYWAGELRSVKRVVNGRTMDITSLVRWQMDPGSAARPLKAWVLVTGRLSGQTAYGWQVTGSIDGQPQPRPFIVKNPPTESLAEFNRLKQQFTLLTQRQDRLNAQFQSAQQLYEQTDAEYLRMGYLRFGGDLLDQRRRAVADLRADGADLDKQIQAFDTRGQDLRGEFAVRCFAIKTAQPFNGMVVYDHGYVLR
jgi:hypothetical protein